MSEIRNTRARAKFRGDSSAPLLTTLLPGGDFCARARVYFAGIAPARNLEREKNVGHPNSGKLFLTA